MDQNDSLLADTDANVNPLDDTPSATAPDAATANAFAPSTSTSLSPLPPFPEQNFADQEIVVPLDRPPSDTSAYFTYPSLPQVIILHTRSTFKERRRRSEQNESHLAIARGFIHSLDNNNDSDDEGSACDHQDDTSTIGDSCVPRRYIPSAEICRIYPLLVSVRFLPRRVGVSLPPHCGGRSRPLVRSSASASADSIARAAHHFVVITATAARRHPLRAGVGAPHHAQPVGTGQSDAAAALRSAGPAASQTAVFYQRRWHRGHAAAKPRRAAIGIADDASVLQGRCRWYQIYHNDNKHE